MQKMPALLLLLTAFPAFATVPVGGTCIIDGVITRITPDTPYIRWQGDCDLPPSERQRTCTRESLGYTQVMVRVDAVRAGKDGYNCDYYYTPHGVNAMPVASCGTALPPVGSRVTLYTNGPAPQCIETVTPH